MRFFTSLLLLLSCSCFLSAFESSDMLHHLDRAFLQTLDHAHTIPVFTDEEFERVRPEIKRLWELLIAKGYVEQEGPDKEIRGPYVGLQAIIEHIFARIVSEDFSIVGIIHTPRPATPLCTKGEISPELVDFSIQNDPLRAYTVKARTTTLRDFLCQGGVLYVAYPRRGLFERTKNEQDIYLDELKNFSDRLIDLPLQCESIPVEMVGATYVISEPSGELFLFSLRMTQAKDPTENQRVGLWLGSVRNPLIKDRLDSIVDFVNQTSAKQVKLN